MKDVIEICQIVLDNAKNKPKNSNETKELDKSVPTNYQIYIYIYVCVCVCVTTHREI